MGSNQNDRAALLLSAIEYLGKNSKLNIVDTSLVYETEPVEWMDQPRFLNQAIGIDWQGEPEELLAWTGEIETRLGRIRTERYGPRTLDIDILLYGDRVIDTDLLTVPHPRMTERAFVLVPLCDIAPHAVHPLAGCSMKELSDSVSGKEGVRTWKKR